MAIWGLYGPQWQHYADSFAACLAACLPGGLAGCFVRWFVRSFTVSPHRLLLVLFAAAQPNSAARLAAAAAAEFAVAEAAEPLVRKRLRGFSSFPPQLAFRFSFYSLDYSADGKTHSAGRSGGRSVGLSLGATDDNQGPYDCHSLFLLSAYPFL